jgi:hypothetical protein
MREAALRFAPLNGERALLEEKSRAETDRI